MAKRQHLEEPAVGNGESAPVRERKKPDRSDPPYYMLLGSTDGGGSWSQIAVRPSIGRMRRLWREAGDMLRGGYPTMKMVRCKTVRTDMLDVVVRRPRKPKVSE